MKNIMIAVVMVIVLAFQWRATNGPGGYADTPPPGPEQRTGRGIRKVEYRALIDSQRAFSDLTVPGYYTVVEVYLDSCGVCRRLEKTFPAFLRKRRDVLIRRVHIPEKGLNLAIEGSTREEIEHNAALLNKRMASYQVCGTPHVEVYDPQGQTLARDNCGDKNGLEFLRSWISDELGQRRSLL